jgi:hypothetical protein
MPRYCPSCGSIIIENASFCNNCGTKFGENIVQPQSFAPTFSPPKKSNMKLISIIAVIIVVVILVSVVLLFMFGFMGGDEQKIVGTWKHIDPTITHTTTFNSDGTGFEYYPSSDEKDYFTYQLKEGILYWWYVSGDPDPDLYIYSFSDNDTTLTLTYIHDNGEPGETYGYHKQ